MDVERKLTAAAAYSARGWKLFTVQENKKPWKNCENCPAGAHDGEECAHVFCHGHLAATGSMSSVEDMLAKRPKGLLAVRTGSPSGLLVVDAEGTDRVGYGCTGVEYLDTLDFPQDTLRARTGGGGVHLFYGLEPDKAISSRNRLAPNIDVKADGGYVVLPPAVGRSWQNWTPLGGVPAAAPQELLEWIDKTKASASGPGGSGGGSLRDRVAEDGMIHASRYEFTRDMVYKLRKQGVSRERAEEIMFGWYGRYAQPPLVEYELPWSQVVYELDRVWARVEAEPPLDERLQRWMASRKEAGS